MAQQPVTKINPSGLRYESKVSGSPFKSSGNSRSCIRCGKHRAPGQLKTIRLFGRAEFACKDGCDNTKP